MTKLFFICALSAVCFLSACSTQPEKKTAAVNDSLANSLAGSNNGVAADELVDATDKKLKETSLTASRMFYKLYHFSGAVENDTLVLYISEGAIGTSLSRFEIHSPKGELLYADTFHTRYFVRDILEPGSYPDSLPTSAYDRYRLVYINALSSRKIIDFVWSQTNKFLEETMVDKYKQFKNLPADDDGILNQAEFKTIMADPALCLIWLPFFEGDEGGSWIGYSRKQRKGMMVYASD
jgi:arsenate reductase-like glutaredoxin family protein